MIDQPPAVNKFGVPVRETASTQQLSKTSETMVLSNYVKVTHVPPELYAYSLVFNKPTKKGPRVEHNKRREIQVAFGALAKLDALGLDANNTGYVTDFKTLWTTDLINGHRSEEGYTFNSTEFEYIQPNGKNFSNLRAEVAFIRHLSNIAEKLSSHHLTDLPEYIRALNACVAQCVENNQEKTGKSVSPVGANKFFLDKGYVTMAGLRAGRGYFTSIRPGEHNALLNFNLSISAFLPPETVTNFLRKLVVKGSRERKVTYGCQLLGGATLKILYKKSNYTGSDVNYNSEEARLKLFTQFGIGAKDLRFYKLVDSDGDKPRISDPKDPGTTVFDYFTGSKSIRYLEDQTTHTKIDAKVRFPRTSEENLLCVNVGKRVRTRLRHGEAQNSLMREKSEEGAQWIPPCLLQIVPGQVVKMPPMVGTRSR